MKLERLKVFQSVKIGSVEKTFLSDADFEMELQDGLVFITSRKDGSPVVTPLTNVPWFVPKRKAVRAPRKKKPEPNG